MTGSTKPSRPPYLFIAIFSLLTILLTVSAYLYHESEVRDIWMQEKEEVDATASFKVAQIVSWRKERLADARVIFENPALARRVDALFRADRQKGDAASFARLRAEMLQWMTSRKVNYDYRSLLLLDAAGSVQLFTEGSHRRIDGYTQSLVSEAMQKRNVVFGDLHRSDDEAVVHMDLVVPLLLPSARDTVHVGTLVLHIDPQRFLFPLIQSWPTLSPTAEALLVRREGSDVAYLNELRHRKGTALRLRLPVSDQRLLEALAARGQKGTVEGVDYRGVPVLGAIKHIPESPWFLVAKMDLEEILAPSRERGLTVSLFALVLIAGCGLALALVWRQREARHYRALFEASVERRALLEHFDYLVKYANDIILLTDEPGRIIEANDRAVKAYGYSRDELLRLNLAALRAPQVPIPLKNRYKQIADQDGFVYESLHRRKDGSEFPVELSSRVIEIHGKKFYQHIARDVTERKRAEEQIHYQSALLKSVNDAIVASDAQYRLTAWNAAAESLYGWKAEQVLGRNGLEIVRTEWPGVEAEKMRRTIAETGCWRGEATQARKDGTRIPVEVSSMTLRDERGHITGYVSVNRDITERKRAEEALRASEERYRTTVMSVGDAVITTDTEGRVDLLNPVAEALTGWRQEEARGKPLEEVFRIINEETRKTVENPVRRVMREGLVVGLANHSVLIAKDGTEHSIADSGAPIRGAKGAITGVVLVFRDQTQERAAQKALRESEARFRIALENSPIVVFNQDRELRYTWVYNPHPGFDPQAVLGKTDTELLPVDDAARLTEIKRRVLKTGVTVREEVKTTIGGQSFFYDLTVEPLRDLNGNIIGVTCASVDITERKRTEEALRESEARYRAVLQSANDAIVTADRDGTIIGWNKAAERLFGYAYTEAVGQPITCLMPERHRAGHANGFNRLQSDAEPNVIGKTVELEGLRKDGSEFSLELSLAQWEVNGNRFFTGIIRNITERRRAEESLAAERTLLRTLIDNLPDRIYVKDTQCRFLVNNIAHMQALGAKTLKEILGKTDFDYRPSELAARYYADDQAVVQSGQPILNREEPTILPSGKRGWLLSTKVPFRDQQGKVIGLMGISRDITERKRAEEEIKMLSAVVEQSTEGMAISDLDGNLTFVNEAWCRMHGYKSSKELLGKSLAVFHNKEQMENEVKPFNEKVIELGTCSGEVGHITRDGKPFTILMTTTLLKDEQGKPYALAGIAKDITERKQAEEALREIEDRFHRLVENAQDIIYRYRQHPSPGFEYVSPACTAITGYTPEEHCADPELRFKMVHIDDRHLLEATMEGKMPYGAPITLRWIRKDGRIIWTEQRNIPIHDDAGNLIAIEGIVRDITERMEVEQALQQSEERYRSFFQEDITADFISTPDGRLLTANPAFLRLFGFSTLEEATATRVSDLYCDPSVRQAMIERLRKTRKIESFEIEMRRTDGSLLHILLNIFGTFDETGKLAEMRGYLLDETKRKMLEEHLREAHKMESIGTLASGIAHDFNNMLGIIVGHASLLEQFGDKPEKLASSVQSIQKASERGAGIVKQLLTFARKADIIFEPLEVNEIVRELYKMISETFPKVIEISLHTGRLPIITADRHQLYQVFLNLCVNARDAMPQGGTLSISTETVPGTLVQAQHLEASAEEYVCVRVSDTGAGMDEAVRRRIFEPFFTTKERTKGTGLGLSVTYGVIKSHRGFIHVETTPGEGSIFFVYLPVPPHGIEPPLQKTAQREEIRGGTETLLAVEDETMLLELLASILERYGYHVLRAPDGEEAVALFKKERDKIALVISDLGLPKFDGGEVFKRMKEILPDVQFVLASGYIEPAAKSELFKAGIKDFIQKPYQAEQILRAIRTILDQEKNRTNE